MRLYRLDVKYTCIKSKMAFFVDKRKKHTQSKNLKKITTPLSKSKSIDQGHAASDVPAKKAQRNQIVLDKVSSTTVDKMVKLRKATVAIGDDKMVMFRTIRGQLFVNIRKYKWDAHNRSSATKTGILLSPDEWKRLKEDTSMFDNVCTLDPIVQRGMALPAKKKLPTGTKTTNMKDKKNIA